MRLLRRLSGHRRCVRSSGVHRNGEVLRPPLIDGRAVLLNNRLMFIVHDRAQEPDTTTIAGYATYILSQESSRIAMRR